MSLDDRCAVKKKSLDSILKVLVLNLTHIRDYSYKNGDHHSSLYAIEPDNPGSLKQDSET